MVGDNQQLIFGKAHAFYKLHLTKEQTFFYVVFSELKHAQTVLGCVQGMGWSTSLCVVQCKNIRDIVGIWDQRSYIYILQKHSGLDMLSSVESGKRTGDEQGKDSED